MFMPTKFENLTERNRVSSSTRFAACFICTIVGSLVFMIQINGDQVECPSEKGYYSILNRVCYLPINRI